MPEERTMGDNFPPEKPSILLKAVSYAVLVGLICPAIGFFMNILNRTRISGREHLAGLKPPFILMSNHLTLLDDLFLGPVILFPQVLRGYPYFPYHAPEERNFYKRRLIGRFMQLAKAIPVVRGNGVHQEGVNRLIRAVKEGGILHIYPEGTRTRTGEIGPAKPGVGRIVYETGAPVVPMFHQGLERILPIGKGIPSFGREIRIAIGEPLQFAAERELRSQPQTWKMITDKIMNAIRDQQVVAAERWGYRPVRCVAAASKQGA
jgi:monolysocardiolipin acyltransferase